jgi:hypothetical protein
MRDLFPKKDMLTNTIAKLCRGIEEHHERLISLTAVDGKDAWHIRHGAVRLRLQELLNSPGVFGQLFKVSNARQQYRWWYLPNICRRR